MTRTYCDKCGNEIHDQGARGRNTTCEEMKGFVFQSDSVATRTNLLHFKILVEPMHNSHICKYCVLDAIAELDDRPKQASVELPITPAKIFQPHRDPDTVVVSTLAPTEPHENYPVK